ncbi:hypothetical protein PTB13_18805, partial [Bacillus sp. MHSD17]|nr:hypothetical protein [Bacillus sp. MHSD17]
VSQGVAAYICLPKTAWPPTSVKFTSIIFIKGVCIDELLNQRIGYYHLYYKKRCPKLGHLFFKRNL